MNFSQNFLRILTVLSCFSCATNAKSVEEYGSWKFNHISSDWASIGKDKVALELNVDVSGKIDAGKAYQIAIDACEKRPWSFYTSNTKVIGVDIVKLGLYEGGKTPDFNKGSAYTSFIQFVCVVETR